MNAFDEEYAGLTTEQICEEIAFLRGKGLRKEEIRGLTESELLERKARTDEDLLRMESLISLLKERQRIAERRVEDAKADLSNFLQDLLSEKD
jgi:hypothetical protein